MRAEDKILKPSPLKSPPPPSAIIRLRLPSLSVSESPINREASHVAVVAERIEHGRVCTAIACGLAKFVATIKHKKFSPSCCNVVSTQSEIGDAVAIDVAVGQARAKSLTPTPSILIPLVPIVGIRGEIKRQHHRLNWLYRKSRRAYYNHTSRLSGTSSIPSPLTSATYSL